MYQDDMINDDDGCGGMNPRHHRPHYLHGRNAQRPDEHKFSVHAQETLEAQRRLEEKKQDDLPNTSSPTCIAPLPPSQVQEPKPSNTQSTTSSSTFAIHRSIAWKKNGQRSLTTAGNPAYYGVYLYQIQQSSSSDTLTLSLMAMGEWNLPEPTTSLFCVTDTHEETWDRLAARERIWMKQANHNTTSFQSRFERALEWKPNKNQNCGRGYRIGQLILPRSMLWPRGKTMFLSMTYDCHRPWQTTYPIVPLLKITPSGALQEIAPGQDGRAPVHVTDPWSSIFPRPVVERFQERERKRRAQQQQQQQL